jgi:hypothetical protein
MTIPAAQQASIQSASYPDLQAEQLRLRQQEASGTPLSHSDTLYLQAVEEAIDRHPNNPAGSTAAQRQAARPAHVQQRAHAAGGAAPTRTGSAPTAEEVNPTKIEAVNYQCVVLEAAHKLAYEHQNTYLPASAYDHVKDLDCGGEYGNLVSRINHGNKTAEVTEIMNLCPDVYALLTPYIHISRVLYDADGKPKPIPAQPLKIPNFLSKTDVRNILSNNLDRAPGAGIKSFKWELAGVQPADVDNNITATLQVYFQSVRDFFQGSEDTTGRATAGRPEPSFLDLIINSPTVSPTAGTSPSSQSTGVCPDNSSFQQYDGENFRIKVCAGWSTPDNLEKIYPQLAKIDRSTGVSRGSLLRKAIKATRVSLFLQQVRHDISLNQDGSLMLTVKYQAALSGLTTSAGSNIFAPGTRENNIVKLRDKIKKEKKNNPAYTETAAYEDDLKEIDKLEQEDRKEKYAKLLRGIYSSKKIYTMRIPAAQLRVPKLYKLPETQRRTAARQRQQRIDAMSAPTTGGTAQSDLLTTLARSETAADAGSTANESAEARNKRLAEQTPAEMIDVNYMYLGDLLDAVMTNLPGLPPSGKPPFECFMAQFEFVDILRMFTATSDSLRDLSRCADPAAAATSEAMQRANPYLNLTKKGFYEEMHIGSIPIALDAFQAFFIEQVVDKERDKYFFLHFVKDLCSKLITRALSGECYGGNFGFFQRFDVQPLSFKNRNFGATPTVSDLAAATSELTCDVMDGQKFGLGLLVMSTDAKHRGLKGEKDKDMAKGIYHHALGSACGLVKTINFQRMDQPYLREAKIQKNGALGAEQLRELYTAKIDLIGNNLYKNGSYIYINPMLMGATKRQLNYLGLHGYFLVTSVSSEITEKSFSTSISALQEGVPGLIDTNTSSTNTTSTSQGASNSSAPGGSP